MWNDLWTGDGIPYASEVEPARHTNHGQLENQPVGLGFPHRAGRYKSGRYPSFRPRVVGVVDVWIGSDPPTCDIIVTG